MSQQPSTFSETEKKAMERYKWWPVYLVREKRRLAGITAAVHAGAAAAGDIPLAHDGNHDDTQPAPPDIEVLDDLVTHADEALDASDLSSELEETGGGEGEESKTQGNSLRDEKTIPDDAQKGKNSARAALLGRKKRSSAADDL